MIKAIFVAGIVLASMLGNAPVTSENDVLRMRSATRPAMMATTTSRSGVPFRVILMEVTAYSPTVAECDASPTITASGKRVYEGGIAADLSVLPFGSRVIIPGYNNGEPCTVIDTGGAIHGNKLDVFFWSTDAANHWGRRKNVPVTVVYMPKEQ